MHCPFRCRGRCLHRPGRLHRFYGNLRRIRNFQAGRCRHRPLQSRSFQASTDKMLCFQGLYGFYRKHPVSLNFLKTIENTGQTGFLRISDDSSQIVVTVISLPEQHFRKNIKTRCLQNYKQRIFICRSIIKIVSNHILSLLAAARKYTDKIETTSSDSG